MRIDAVSIFPDYFSPLDLSLIGRARAEGLIGFRAWDLREFTDDRHRTVDDTPYGGGAGMVMRAEPWGRALDAVAASAPDGAPEPPLIVVPGPGGDQFTQAEAYRLAAEPWLVFACGRYEGIDERVYAYAEATWPGRVRVLSLGDYVLNGGEVAALALIEAVVRLLPGVIGNAESLAEESHTDGLLEYPMYTHPPAWRGMDVPAVLLSGDHAAVAAWRREQRLARTAARRPDLLHPSVAVTGFEAGQIRLAEPGDCAELFTLMRASWVARDNGSFEIPPLVESYDDLRASLDAWRTWVVRDHGRLVASVRARLDGSTWDIGRLMVAEDLRGRGLGRFLLEFAEAQAPVEATHAALFTGAISWGTLRRYRKAGYRPRPGGDPDPVYLAKRLQRR